jgi:hypothetical protein
LDELCENKISITWPNATWNPDCASEYPPCMHLFSSWYSLGSLPMCPSSRSCSYQYSSSSWSVTCPPDLILNCLWRVTAEI